MRYRPPAFNARDSTFRHSVTPDGVTMETAYPMLTQYHQRWLLAAAVAQEPVVWPYALPWCQTGARQKESRHQPPRR
ncbi:hypothetical protein KCP70_01245 [Salmonella enterica subsp. enterica]|nr:hypothetical protein KCP70_01245 [Salmonella enterica subsp. enterica]